MTSSAVPGVRGLSRSVTSGTGFAELLLQIETLVWRVIRSSKSVTSRPGSRSHLLQIEMFEEVSLQAELGAYVVALEVGGVHS